VKAFLRSVAGVVLGACVATGVIILVEQISGRMYPPPAGMDFGDPEAFQSFVAGLPVGAFLMILVAWGLGTFAGAWVCARVAGRWKVAHAALLGALLLVAGVTNMLMIPHPIWMWVGAFAVFAGGGYAGGRLA
jgi:hypothetical protein